MTIGTHDVNVIIQSTQVSLMILSTKILLNARKTLTLTIKARQAIYRQSDKFKFMSNISGTMHQSASHTDLGLQEENQLRYGPLY